MEGITQEKVEHEESALKAELNSIKKELWENSTAQLRLIRALNATDEAIIKLKSNPEKYFEELEK